MTTKRNHKQPVRGRPSKYRPCFDEMAKNLAEHGMIGKEIAHLFGISLRTLADWKTRHKSFADAIKKGNAIADGRVAMALYRRAVGYSHEGDIHVSVYQGQVSQTPLTKHYPPDTKACIFWLKNRQPKLWRDKPAIGVTAKGQTHQKAIVTITWGNADKGPDI